MSVLLLRRGGMGVGAMFVLSLFLAGVMMCAVTLLFLPLGHHFFVEGCGQVSLMMNYVTVDKGCELLKVLVVLFVITVLGLGWKLNGLINKGESILNKEKQLLVRAVMDPVMQAFRQGVIRNLSYN